MYSRLNIQNLITRFSSDQKGAVAILFAVVITVLFGVVSIAIDGARAFNARSQAGNALDAAALAAAKALNENNATDAELLDIANRTFNANIESTRAQSVSFGTLQLQADRTENSVTISIDGGVTTFFGKLLNLDNIAFSNQSTAIYNIKDIELAMMLDTTGSMNGRKLRDLQSAAKDVIDILLGPGSGSNKTRIALAPYAASVNTGSYANTISNNASTDGCVVERTNNTFTDSAPQNGAYFNSIAQANGRARGRYNQQYRKYGCPPSSIMPLTDNADQLKSSVDNFVASGYTAGHLGIAWSWYLISPLWQNIWPSDSRPEQYREEKLIKAVILMTDGEFNAAYKGHPNAVTTESYNAANTLCTNMKNEEIIIYSVAFQAPPSAQASLQSCATSAAHFFNAQNGQELRNAFKDIALRLSQLRIHK